MEKSKWGRKKYKMYTLEREKALGSLTLHPRYVQEEAGAVGWIGDTKGPPSLH